MSPVHSPDAPGTYLPAHDDSQYAPAGQGAAESVAPLLGKFVRIL